MDTAKMIYPEMKLAQLILGKMKRRHPNGEWSIIDLPVGFQVAQKFEPTFDSHPFQALAPAPAQLSNPIGSVVTITLTYGGQSPAFIECNVNGKKIWIGKSILLAYDVDYASKTVVMKMTTAYAKKRGFVLACLTDPMGDRFRLSLWSTLSPTAWQPVAATAATDRTVRPSRNLRYPRSGSGTGGDA